MKKPKYIIVKNIKSDYYYIKKLTSFLFFNWYKFVSEYVGSVYDIEKQPIKFNSIKQCKNYIQNVLEWEDQPVKCEIIEKIWIRGK